MQQGASDFFHMFVQREKKRQDPNALPIISFSLDGVLANHCQAVLDQMTSDGGDFYDWKDLRCPGSCSLCTAPLCLRGKENNKIELSTFLRVAETCASNPDFWLGMEPFDPGDLQHLGDRINGGQFLAFFISDRPCIATDSHDVRYHTMLWLKNHGIENWMGIQVCSEDKITDLGIRQARYHLDDDPEVVIRLRLCGIEAFLIDRPWNSHIECKFRVASIRQFLDLAAPEHEEPFESLQTESYTK